MSDGYSHGVKRADSVPQSISLKVGALPARVETVLFQMFVDDFQARVFHSHFRVTLNGTPIPSFERALNELNQTGPIGKLVSLRLLPEYWPLLRSGTVQLLIDDPTTHATDGYAIDFVRILVNPCPFKYAVSINGQVNDAETHKPLLGAVVTAAHRSTATSSKGTFSLVGVPAGLVVVSAALSGYDESVTTVDLVASRSGQVTFALHPHRETAEDLARAVAQGGSAALYGLRFDFAAKLRPDSTPVLEATLALIRARPESHWTISGHTDSRGSAASNRSLSIERAASVVAWLSQHGVPPDRLMREGFGASRPIADNTTENGRALNRRAEIEPSP